MAGRGCPRSQWRDQHRAFSIERARRGNRFALRAALLATLPTQARDCLPDVRPLTTDCSSSPDSWVGPVLSIGERSSKQFPLLSSRRSMLDAGLTTPRVGPRRRPRSMHCGRRFCRSPQRHERHFRPRPDPERNPPVPRARTDVEQRVLARVRAHRVREERRRETPPEHRERELPPVRVSAQRERDSRAWRATATAPDCARTRRRSRPPARRRARGRCPARRATFLAGRPRDRPCRRARSRRRRVE